MHMGGGFTSRDLAVSGDEGCGHPVTNRMSAPRSSRWRGPEGRRTEDLDTAARVAVALERLVDEKELDGLAYYYEGEPESPMRQLVTNLIVGNSLLTAAGFPMCGESDLKTCIAMFIEDRLDIGGSFAEFHPIDFREGFAPGGARRAAPHQHRRRQTRSYAAC